MRLLSYAASKFEVPLTYKDLYDLKKISFTENHLIATYGDEDFNFDVVIRGQS